MFYKFLLVFSIVGVAIALPETESFRVVNGTNAKKGEFPFAVSLRDSRFNFRCGGSILNKKWILTAAHCTVKKIRPINVQYGVTVISKQGPNYVKVKKIIVHEKYKHENFANDIALLLLEKPLIFSDKVKPVALPKPFSEVPARSKATLIGWGREKEDGVPQKHLQKADLITFSYKSCKMIYNEFFHKQQICAGVPEGGKGDCKGDSGSPLLVKGVQVGIVSWGVKPCSSPLHPGVYTKVSQYVNWIKEKTRLGMSVSISISLPK